MITVKELISRCDRRKLCQEFIASFSEVPRIDDPEKAIDGLSRFIEKLLTIEPVYTEDDIVINNTCYEVSWDGPYENTSVYSIQDILKYYEPILEYDELDGINIETLSDSDIERLFKVFERIYDKREEYDPENKAYCYPGCVRGYSYGFIEWKKILGWLVPDHILGTEDESGFAAAILKEMTFFGFDEKDMIEKREELLKSMDEFDKIRELPEEEQEKHYVSLEEVERHFGYVDERTPEEKARDKFEQRKRMAFDSILQYRAVKKVYIELKDTGKL